MSRTERKYEPSLKDVVSGSRRYKGVGRSGLVIGADGMVATHSETMADKQYKLHAIRKERHSAKDDLRRHGDD